MSVINGFEVDKYNQYNFPESATVHTCPECSHTRKKKTDKCLKIYWDTGLAECFHCGVLLQLHTYKKKSVTEKIYTRPKWKNETKLSDSVVNWFESRGISQHVLRVMRISEGKEWMPQTRKEENTIQFNYFRDRELINVKYRDARKNFKMYKDAQKIFYNIDAIKYSTECIIVEGEIDALSFVEAGILNVVSVPNGSTEKSVNLDYLDDCYTYFENKEKIFLALDNDGPGQNVTNELIRRLGAERCYLVDFGEYKDANELLDKEGKQALVEAINNAEPCPMENVTTLKDFEGDLEDFYLNGAKKGYTTGMKNFDSVFSTYTGQFLVVTGIPSHGKSNFVDQMTLGYAVEHDWKTAYASPENVPEHLHADSICQRILGRKPKNLVDLRDLKWIKTKEFVEDHFFHLHFDKYDLKSVLKKFEEVIKRKGVRCCVIDPFNKVRLKESLHKDRNEYANDYLSEIDTFARKHDVFVILVAHPVKMEKNKEGKRVMPDFYSIKGGGEFYDMSPHGIAVHRHFDEQYIEVKVLKVKFRNLGENGASCYFAWNINNGRFTPINNLTAYIEGIERPEFDNKFLLGKYATQMKIPDYGDHASDYGFDPEQEETDSLPF